MAMDYVIGAAPDPDDIPLDGPALLMRELREHREVFEQTALAISAPFAAALHLLERAIRARRKILLFGNGGSAADAQHIAAELTVRYVSNRAPIAAIALSTDTSALTACANDLGFDAIFARQIAALGLPGDVAVGISTSGNSPNVLNALEHARAAGLATLGLTGGQGGKLPALCDALIIVPSAVTARIQEMHILIGHMLCKSLEQRLGLVG
jgi:D-sedoheptulose 7-phosphate isomerase